MKTFATMLVAASLLILAAPCGLAEPAAGAAAPDKMTKARIEEEKGDLARAHSNYDMAAFHYANALRIDRENSDLYDKVGVAEMKLKGMKSARKHFNLALKYNPRDAVALNNLGAVAYLTKKNKQAIGYFKQALALNEASASTHLNLAEAWLALGDTDRAMTEYARALELNADLLNGNPDGIQARISTPEQRARVSYQLAKAYMKRGNLDGALEYLRRAKEYRYHDLAKVYTDQEFAPLWKDPRLAKIIKR
jgi:tetratricopeptide (TPR) repeat protein